MGRVDGSEIKTCNECGMTTEDLYYSLHHPRRCSKTVEKELSTLKLQVHKMTDALNKIHDLAGQVSGSHFINSNMGAIQDWCHRVTGPCVQKRKQEMS
jgi:hypothetical protein